MTRRLEAARSELDDPAVTAIAIAILTVLTFAVVRLTGGAPSALMELGYAPVALAAYAFGWRGALATGILVAAVLGPVPALLGLARVEGPAEWLIRATSFAGIGVVVGRLMDRTASNTTDVRRRLVEVTGRERAGLVALARAAESRDTDAGEHVRRLQITASRLADRVGMEPEVAEGIGWSAMLHDLGKLRVPDRILMKPGPLDGDEWIIVRHHPIWSEQALGDDPQLATAREIARSHHENWDGSGYPDGLYGDRIPLAARIVRICDTFDALTNRRPYQQAVSFEAALEELAAGAAHDFDPELVMRFIELVRDDAALRNELLGLRLI